MGPGVQDRKGKHPHEARQHLGSKMHIGLQEDFGVALRAEGVAVGRELMAQFSIIVNGANENDICPTVGRPHRLPAGRAEIENRQAAMHESNVARGQGERILGQVNV